MSVVKCGVQVWGYFHLDRHGLQSSQFNSSQVDRSRLWALPRSYIRYAPAHLCFALPLSRTVQPNAPACAPPADVSHTTTNFMPVVRGDHTVLDIHLQRGSCQLKTKFKHLTVTGTLVKSLLNEVIQYGNSHLTLNTKGELLLLKIIF